MKLLTIYQIIKLRTSTFMYRAFNINLPYNLQKHFLVERTDYEVVTGKMVPSDKHMYAQQKINTAFQLQILSCGIALKIRLIPEKQNTILRQNSFF